MAFPRVSYLKNRMYRNMCAKLYSTVYTFVYLSIFFIRTDLLHVVFYTGTRCNKVIILLVYKKLSTTCSAYILKSQCMVAQIGMILEPWYILLELDCGSVIHYLPLLTVISLCKIITIIASYCNNCFKHQYLYD